MSYDFGKISSQEALQQIADHIRKQLASSSAFNNNSLAYFGIELEYKIKVTLHSRGKSTETYTGNPRFGDMPENASVQRGLAQENEQVKQKGGSESTLEESHVEIGDSVGAGTVRKVVGKEPGTQAGMPGGPEAGASEASGKSASGEGVGEHGTRSGTQAHKRYPGGTRS